VPPEDDELLDEFEDELLPFPPQPVRNEAMSTNDSPGYLRIFFIQIPSPKLINIIYSTVTATLAVKAPLTFYHFIRWSDVL